MQGKDELEKIYSNPDPWDYETTPDDQRRLVELKALLQGIKPKRTIDIGCGNGFLSVELPGEEVFCVDLAEKAVKAVKKRVSKLPDRERYRFGATNLFDLATENYGQFDLVVITGVLYPQYVGKATSTMRAIVDQLLSENAILASCHIMEWNPPIFQYTLLDRVLYPYREFTHLLEVYKKCS